MKWRGPRKGAVRWQRSRLHRWLLSLVGSDLDEMTKHVGPTMTAHTDNRGTGATLSTARLVEGTGYGDPDVAASTAALRDGGWLRLHVGPSRNRHGNCQQWAFIAPSSAGHA